MKSLYPATLALLFMWGLFINVPAARACRAPRPSAQAMVERADIIVRATALNYVIAPKGNIRALNEPGDATIEFSVKEVLKGENLPSTISLHGYLTDKDDFNDRPVPYDFVRMGGRGGSCSAYEYRQGAQFLLFLKKADDKLTVRWYPLAPTNEQLHSADDPWVTWVREQLKSEGRKGSYQSAAKWFSFALRLQPWITARLF